MIALAYTVKLTASQHGFIVTVLEICLPRVNISMLAGWGKYALHTYDQHEVCDSMTLEARKTVLAFAWLRWSVFVSSSRGAQISSCQKLWRGLLGNRKRNRGKATCPDRLRRTSTPAFASTYTAAAFVSTVV